MFLHHSSKMTEWLMCLRVRSMASDILKRLRLHRDCLPAEMKIVFKINYFSGSWMEILNIPSVWNSDFNTDDYVIRDY